MTLEDMGVASGAKSFQQSHLASCSSSEARCLIERQHALEYGVLPLTVFDDGFGRRTVSFVFDDGKSQAEITEKLKYLTAAEVEVESCKDKSLYKSVILAYLQDQDSIGNNLLEEILHLCWALDASDFHFMPTAREIDLKLRVNGEMVHSCYFAPKLSLSSDSYQEMLRRLKNLASLDLTEHNLPQEGACSFECELYKVRLRLSIIPGKFGPYLSVRLIGVGEFSSSESLEFSKLGFNLSQSRSVQQEIEKNNGVILFTGPTGSGKSTALQACLKHLSGEQQRIVSVEDPVERELSGVTQIEVDLGRMRSYCDYLPVILRQDPDIIGIGEIRDRDSARFVFDAGSTGHLVLSGMHAESVVTAMMRLLDFGLTANRLLSAINLVVNQRLVLANCQHCLKAEVGADKVRKFFSLGHHHRTYKSQGCKSCSWSSHGGRVPVYDLVQGAKIQEIIQGISSGKPSRVLSRPIGIYQSLRNHIATGTISSKEGLRTLGLD